MVKGGKAVASAAKVTAGVKRSGRTKRKVDYSDDAAFSAVDAATAPKKSRAASSGYKELDGKAPYRPDFVKGVQADVLPGVAPAPKRSAKGELVFADHTEFRPVLSPEQVIRLGAFGGTYWRPITSGVTGTELSGCWKEFPASWFAGVPQTQITRSWKGYNIATNRYNVKCGGSLDMWESSGWISNLDPYGWFQWYCRFFLGRRTTDDGRQIARWSGTSGPKGRFRNQLIGRCARAGTSYDDRTISPVIRQSLMHWGYELSAADAEKYVKLKKLPKMKAGAPAVDFATLGLPK